MNLKYTRKELEQIEFRLTIKFPISHKDLMMEKLRRLFYRDAESSGEEGVVYEWSIYFKTAIPARTALKKALILASQPGTFMTVGLFKQTGLGEILEILK